MHTSNVKFNVALISSTGKWVVQSRLLKLLSIHQQDSNGNTSSICHATIVDAPQRNNSTHLLPDPAGDAALRIEACCGVAVAAADKTGLQACAGLKDHLLEPLPF